MSIIKQEYIGGQRLILGDCLKVMPMLGRFDACVTDPPYGIDYGNAGGFSADHGWATKRGAAEWDKQRPEPEIFAAMLAQTDDQIIWGGNYFADLLPPSMGWLAWDKAQRGFSLSDFELAWTSLSQAARFFQYGRGNEKGFAPRSTEQQQFLSFHPTQKPIAVMQWCLELLPLAKTIVDPFSGGFSTLVACERLGRVGVGIEIDSDYFDVACRRVDEAARQPRMDFAPAPPAPTQETLI